jgi:hypothetical protein
MHEQRQWHSQEGGICARRMLVQCSCVLFMVLAALDAAWAIGAHPPHAVAPARRQLQRMVHDMSAAELAQMRDGGCVDDPPTSRYPQGWLAGHHAECGDRVHYPPETGLVATKGCGAPVGIPPLSFQTLNPCSGSRYRPRKFL